MVSFRSLIVRSAQQVALAQIKMAAAALAVVVAAGTALMGRVRRVRPVAH